MERGLYFIRILRHMLVISWSPDTPPSFFLFSSLRPDLMRDRKRRSKTKYSIFRSGFFDQKEKNILCDRILAISEQQKMAIEKYCAIRDQGVCMIHSQ